MNWTTALLGLAVLSTGCAHAPCHVAHERCDAELTGPATLEALDQAIAERQLCRAFAILEQVAPTAAPERLVPLKNALLDASLTEVARLRALKTMASWEVALTLLTQMVALDPAHQPLRQEVQAEFDEHLWGLYQKMRTPQPIPPRRPPQLIPAPLPAPDVR